MNAAHRLVIEAMEASLGSMITKQVRDYANGEDIEHQNPNAMRKALEWLALRWVDQMLKQALSDDAYEAVCDLAAEIEQDLQGVK